ncbi:ArsR family transcriptional regulator [Egibacter rhizosphaerae]|uniref:ArsR family transcriptional regulator n=1 Tax=Egibacter rhizosphaerae TaxID=1670831 RepID=UPI0013F15A69|nr:ArsR family transcriptional regulator [Egibacter rhizosphaerae]
MQDRDAVWQALASPGRRRIIDLLRSGPLTTGAIVEATGVDRFAVQRHLGVLRKAGLVLVTAYGRERHNTLNASALYQATIGWLRPIDRHYATVLDGLRDQLESNGEETLMDLRRLHVAQQIDIAAEAPRCFEALTGDISPWWGSPCLLIDRAETRITAEPRVGGLVSEHADDEEAAWGTVSELAADRSIAWTGRIGLGDAVTGTVRFTLTERAGGTRIDLEHESIGAFGPGSQHSYDDGWRDLLHRLKALLEDGESYGVTGTNAQPPTIQAYGSAP